MLGPKWWNGVKMSRLLMVFTLGFGVQVERNSIDDQFHSLKNAQGIFLLLLKGFL